PRETFRRGGARDIQHACSCAAAGDGGRRRTRARDRARRGRFAAAYAAAALMLVIAFLTSLALLRGKRGAPCGCFGARSRVGPGAVLRALAGRGVRRRPLPA